MASNTLDVDRAIDVGFIKTGLDGSYTYGGKTYPMRCTTSAFAGTGAWVEAIVREGLDGWKLRVMLVPEPSDEG